MSTKCLETLPEWQLSTIKTPVIERSHRKRLETPSTYIKCYEAQRKCTGYSWCVRTLPDSHLSTIAIRMNGPCLHTWYIATKHYQTQNSGSQSTRFLQCTYVRPSAKSFFSSDFDIIWCVDRPRPGMHTSMTDPIQGQDQGYGASEIVKIALF